LFRPQLFRGDIERAVRPRIYRHLAGAAHSETIANGTRESDAPLPGGICRTLESKHTE